MKYQNNNIACTSARSERAKRALCCGFAAAIMLAACGGEARVPFEPKTDRPVYCSECFAKMRAEQ